MKYQVIFHIDEEPKWGLLLGNVENLLKASGDELPVIEVLANGEAVLEYKLREADSMKAGRIEALHRQGVTFAACQNAMKANGLTKEMLMGFVDTVPAGVLELVERQSLGYAYIKP